MSDFASLFKSVELPVMPEVGLALINTLDDEDTPVAKIHALVSQDPALTVKLLALANSAAFGLPRKVATLEAALGLVGLSRVRTLALSACLHNAFSMPEGIDRSAFWHYCMHCAGYAQWLAGGVDTELDKQKAWLAGMMLRLGELLLGHALPEAVQEFEQSPSQPGDRWVRERRIAGFTEGEVTAELARRWNFPSDIVLALGLAADPLSSKPMAPMAGVLHLAGLLADVPKADAEAIDTLPVPVMSALGLKYGWMKTDFPDAGNFVQVGA